MNKINYCLISLLIINIVLFIVLSWWLLNNFNEQILDVNTNNRKEVVALLKKSNIEICEDKNLTQVKIKQGLGDVMIYLNYEQNTIIDDSEEIIKYIEKEGKKVGYHQEKICNFSKISIIIISLLIPLNLLLNKFKNKKC